MDKTTWLAFIRNDAIIHIKVAAKIADNIIPETLEPSQNAQGFFIGEIIMTTDREIANQIGIPEYEVINMTKRLRLRTPSYGRFVMTEDVERWRWFDAIYIVDLVYVTKLQQLAYQDEFNKHMCGGR